ncbi:bestrophin-2-like isoform X2 [Lineus longissimus]|uniref:bestrophin-2-like isoform X2 n=1 Tax=Lineus longissimus TaxID=88925 RepID=UPI002B4F2F9C
MTITYTAEVASSSWGCFLKLLFRWKGSIYKLLWKELIVFLGLYYLLNLIYRFALTADQKVIFERIVLYCDSFNNLIPVAFVLGFYVSVVCTRWWDQFKSIPWPDRTALFVSALIHGQDERPRLMRRTIMRYMVLSFTMTLSSISLSVKKRFPTLDHMREAGLMLEGEQKIIEDLKTPHSKYFVPIVWATSLVSRARKEGLIKDDFAVKTIIDEINSYRSDLGMLYNYDWVNIPMVYTQVVTLAVYTFFLSCIMGRQFLDPKKGYENHRPDMYFPVFTLLQFFFYLGWLKVAETLINPFGEDDDDFEMNSTIDRNIQVSYLIVDEMHSEFPELIKDQYWDETDFEMPWTHAAEKYRMEPHLGSAVDIAINSRQADFVPMSSIREEYPMVDRRQTSDAMDLPNPVYNHRPDYEGNSQSRPRANSKNRFLDSLKRMGSRGSGHSVRSPTSTVDHPHPGGSYVSVTTTTPMQTPTTPMSPDHDGEDDIFAMSDLGSNEDNASAFSSNPFRDPFKRIVPSKSETIAINPPKHREEPPGSTSSDRTLKGSMEKLTNHNHNEYQADSQDVGDSARLISQDESETSFSRKKHFAASPAKLIIKSASECQVKDSYDINGTPIVSESLPSRV